MEKRDEAALITTACKAPLRPTDLFPSPPIKRYPQLEGNDDKVVGYKNGRPLQLVTAFPIFLDISTNMYENTVNNHKILSVFVNMYISN